MQVHVVPASPVATLAFSCYTDLDAAAAQHPKQQQQQMQQRTMGRMVMRRQRANPPKAMPTICPMVKSASEVKTNI